MLNYRSRSSRLQPRTGSPSCTLPATRRYQPLKRRCNRLSRRGRGRHSPAISVHLSNQGREYDGPRWLIYGLSNKFANRRLLIRTGVCQSQSASARLQLDSTQVLASVVYNSRSMDSKTLRVLEYDKILERLKLFCDFSASMELARALEPTDSYDLALARLA